MHFEFKSKVLQTALSTDSKEGRASANGDGGGLSVVDDGAKHYGCWVLCQILKAQVCSSVVS